MINHPQLLQHYVFFILLCGPISEVISQTSQILSTVAMNQPSSNITHSAPETTPNHGLSMCFVDTEGNGVVCRSGSGTCVGNTNATRCQCEALYAGNDCGQLDLRIPVKDVFETGIHFVWTTEIQLIGFYSLFTRTPVLESSELTLDEIPSNFTDKVTVNGLLPDAREYLVCIIHEDYLGNVSNINMSTLLANNVLDNTNANCGIAVTPFDRLGPFTLAAWGIAIALGVVVLLLLVFRACYNCRHSERRNELIAKTLGKFDFLRRSSSKKQEQEDGMSGSKNAGSAYKAGGSDDNSGIHTLGV